MPFISLTRRSTSLFRVLVRVDTCAGWNCELHKQHTLCPAWRPLQKALKRLQLKQQSFRVVEPIDTQDDLSIADSALQLREIPLSTRRILPSA